MDMLKLETLLALAEYGSFSDAAKAIYRTQSAASQQIKELEKELDICLVDRSKRPIELTVDGAELVAVARQIVTLWNDYKNKRKSSEIKGKLVLGYVNSAITSNLSNALRTLRQEYPQLVIKLVNTGGVSRHLAQDVAEQKLDASFGVGPLKLPKGVLWWPYAREQFYVISPKESIYKNDADLLGHGPYLRHKPHLLHETMIDREIKRRGLNVEVTMELDAYESILLMVQHGIGVGIVPESYLHFKKKLNCNYIPFGSPPLTREVGMLVRSDNPQKFLLRLLWNVLKEISNKQLVNKIFR